MIKMLGSLDKSKTPGHCGFPLTNLHFAESVDVVPKSNLFKQLKLFCICSWNTQSLRTFLD